jgi:glutamine amidotransferase
MIGIVNYQRGNLNNVKRAFEKFGFQTKIIDSPDEIEQFSGLVLPGVGAFGDAMENLNQRNFKNPIIKWIKDGNPFMGICLGLQLLFEKSYEFGQHQGLGILKGEVVPFSIKLKVPHMGWNQLNFVKKSAILKSIPDHTSCYFVHSFYVAPCDENIVLTKTSYEIDFVSSIEDKNLFACQFHPEKSQESGLQMIKDFGAYCANNSSN